MPPKNSGTRTRRTRGHGYGRYKQRRKRTHHTGTKHLRATTTTIATSRVAATPTGYISIVTIIPSSTVVASGSTSVATVAAAAPAPHSSSLKASMRRINR
jgi:hypothetical protein